MACSGSWAGEAEGSGLWEGRKKADRKRWSRHVETKKEAFPHLPLRNRRHSTLDHKFLSLPMPCSWFHSCQSCKTPSAEGNFFHELTLCSEHNGHWQPYREKFCIYFLYCPSLWSEKHDAKANAASGIHGAPFHCSLTGGLLLRKWKGPCNSHYIE